MSAQVLAVAERELEEAKEYYDAQQPGLGIDFVYEFRKALELVLRWPGAWPQVARTRNARRIQLDRFPYKLIYQLIGEDILIVAVAHTRRRATYWRDRLR